MITLLATNAVAILLGISSCVMARAAGIKFAYAKSKGTSTAPSTFALVEALIAAGLAVAVVQIR